MEDILIACIDGLKGFPEAIHAVYPQTEIQLCIVHQIEVCSLEKPKRIYAGFEAGL